MKPSGYCCIMTVWLTSYHKSSQGSQPSASIGWVFSCSVGCPVPIGCPCADPSGWPLVGRIRKSSLLGTVYRQDASGEWDSGTLPDPPSSLEFRGQCVRRGGQLWVLLRPHGKLEECPAGQTAKELQYPHCRLCRLGTPQSQLLGPWLGCWI